MQKVTLLPRMPGYKKCQFTKRLVTINLSFVPLGEGKSKKQPPVAVIWHKGIAGRCDEDVTSAYTKFLSYPKFRDYQNWVIWADNCSGQNKCWTLYTQLVRIVNSPENDIKKLTIKYLKAGHTFMSADHWHGKIEEQFRKMDKIYDFDDYDVCISEVGETIKMNCTDFYHFENGLSQSKASKDTRPLLCNVYVAEFRRGSFSFFFKTHDSEEFKECLFLKVKSRDNIEKNISVPSQSEPRGIPSWKLHSILDNLSSLLPHNRKPFFINLHTNDNSVDLIDND